MKIIKVFLFLLFCFPGYGQPPGFLGKRASIDITFSAFPAIPGPSKNDKGRYAFDQSNAKTGLNFQYSGSFSYVVSRYGSVSFSVGNFNTGAIARAFTIPVGIEVLDPNNDGSERDQHELFYGLNIRSYDFAYNLYKKKKGAIAPVGNRMYFGFRYCSIRPEIIKGKTQYYFGELGALLGSNTPTLHEKTNLNFLFFGLSNDKIIGNRIIFKTGFKVSIPLIFSENVDDGLSFGTPVSNHPEFRTNPSQAYYDVSSRERLWKHELFNFNIGIGYLLF